jgi:hypothetical protein
MQWHGNDRDRRLGLGPTGIESGRGLRQHAPQRSGCGPHLLVFQQMDQFAQPAIVTAIGHRFGEGRLQPSAQSASRFPADRANAARNRLYFRKARQANRQTGNIYQGGTAKTTIGGEEGGEEAFRSAAHGGNQGGHQRTVPRRNLGPGSPDWVPATAEDEPPASARVLLEVRTGESPSV